MAHLRKSCATGHLLKSCTSKHLLKACATDPSSTTTSTTDPPETSTTDPLTSSEGGGGFVPCPNNCTDIACEASNIVNYTAPGGWSAAWNGGGTTATPFDDTCYSIGTGGSDDNSYTIEIECTAPTKTWIATITRTGDGTNPVQIFTAPTDAIQCIHGHTWTSVDGGSLTIEI